MMSEVTCGSQYVPEPPTVTGGTILQTSLVTVIIIVVFIVCRTVYENICQQLARITVVVIGAGPIGLLAAILASRNCKVKRVLVYEEKSRKELLSRPQQVALNPSTVCTVRNIGVDLDSIEGCWQNKCFLTPITVIQEYMLDMIDSTTTNIDVRLKTKFSKECLKELDAIQHRLLVIVCDGSQGRSSTLLGLSDEFTQHSCSAYGAVASLERNIVNAIPLPEIHVHKLTFDLNAYANHSKMASVQKGFHFKIFGTNRHRYMCLAVNHSECNMLKSLKSTLDPAVLRNIFQVCFNTYKHGEETEMTEKQALRQLHFSPRLFEIKLYQRLESVMYVKDGDVFVITEGEAARYTNFYTGLDINLSIKGLTQLDKFISLAATARSEKNILGALKFKFHHHTGLGAHYVKHGFADIMFR